MGANKNYHRGKKSKLEKEEQDIEEEDDSDQVESEKSEDSDGGSSDDDATSESGSESEGEEDVAAALFKGPKEESESEDDSEGEESIDDADRPSTTQQNEAYTFDLRNMLAINTDQLAIGSFYDSKKTKSRKFNNLEIPLDPIRGKSLEVNEDYLLSKATDGCSELIRSLWELPTESSDAGPLVTLPTYDEIRLPRAMVRKRIMMITIPTI